MGIFSKIINYFKEVRSELGKVTWPSKSTTVNYTIAVIVFSIAMTVFLGGLDLTFSYLLNKYIL